MMNRELMARRAIERKRDCDGSWNILGRALLSQGKYEEAAKLAEQAIEANGDDYNTYIPYGVCLERLGQKKEAEQLRARMNVVLRQQLETGSRRCARPNSAGLAIWPLSEKPTRAIRHLQTAVALRPNDGNTFVQRRVHLRYPAEKNGGPRHAQESHQVRLRKSELGLAGHRPRLPPRRSGIPEASRPRSRPPPPEFRLRPRKYQSKRLSFRIPPSFQAGEESAVYSTHRATNSLCTRAGAHPSPVRVRSLTLNCRRRSHFLGFPALLKIALTKTWLDETQTCHSDRSEPTLFLQLRSAKLSAREVEESLFDLCTG